MTVLFLDFDGVLHPQDVYVHQKRGVELRAPGHKLFEYASVLERLLAPHPDLRVVLSTSWVPMRGYRRALSMLPPSLQARVVGATFHSHAHTWQDWARLARGRQVVENAARRGLTRWLALDDDADSWPEQYLDRLVRCHPMRGLGDPAVQVELRSKLAAM